MKKVLALILVLAMVLSMAACGGEEETGADKTYKIGMVCIGDQNQAYDRNFYDAADKATEILKGKGINVEWIYTYNHPDGNEVTVDNQELAEKGCIAVFNNSYGQEPYMLIAAKDYPNTVFIGMTNMASRTDNLDNTVNTFPAVYEGRYVAGVAAGLKLNELIENGTITPDQAVIGYVGAYTFAEVISGYTAYFLGARSVCPSATMKVEFIGSWGDPTMEANAAQDLIDRGAVLISQHSDSTTPATTAQANGKFHTGYNVDMSGADIAPNASIISARIDWTNYFVYVIETIVAGKKVDPDYCDHGIQDGDVALTAVNEKVAAPGTADKLKEVEAKIASGEIKVFDTSTFTVDGQTVTTAFAFDTDGDFVNDAQEAIVDGVFLESHFQSAPYFTLRIDGIELLNEAY